MNILILGAYGLLGSSLSHYLEERSYNVLRQGRRKEAQIALAPSESGALRQLLAGDRVDAVINLIAATDVDECELNSVAAYKVNVGVVEALVDVLVSWPHEKTPHMIHISTDQVYDGAGPHIEEDVAPCNEYASTKLSAEIAAQKVGATVLRTNFVGKSHAKGRTSLSDWMVESFRTQKQVTLFDDVFFSALHTTQLCSYIEKALQLKVSGTFNVGCSDGISKAAFGLALAERLNLDTSFVSVGLSTDFKFKARRPLDMRMDVTKFEQVFKVKAPIMEQTVEQVAREYL